VKRSREGARSETVMRNTLTVTSTAVTIVSLLMLAIPTPVFSNVPFTHAVTTVPLSKHEIRDEPDPDDSEDCFTLGELDIAFRTNHNGPPQIGVVLTDPRGRRTGFDPLTKHAWGEIPEGEGFIDCDSSDGKDTCSGYLQVCGPLSGSYELEVIGRESSNYTVSVSARSKEIRNGERFWSSRSNTKLNNLAIRQGSRDVISLSYSRDAALKVAAQLQKHRNGQNENHFRSTACQSNKQEQHDCGTINPPGN
jgi:hypothetical protein